jgi:hypothetical protein
MWSIRRVAARALHEVCKTPSTMTVCSIIIGRRVGTAPPIE